MALQIPSVVRHADNIDHVFAAAAVDQKVPRVFDNTQVAPGPISAEKEMVGADAPRQFRSLSRSCPFRVGRDVAKCLL